ncbi:MAG: carbohydrate kinase family protein, partial [Candidatus Sericytochromatia bacterium]
MSDYDVITIGGATQDVFARCEGAQVIRQSGRSHENAWIGFDYGAKLPIDDLRFMVGGGATNTAASFSKLGLRTATVAKLGLDGAGDHVVAELTRQGIDTSLLCRAPGQTGYSIILTSYEGERSVLAYRGLNRELGIQDLDFARLGQT